jgi:hypothetical protein
MPMPISKRIIPEKRIYALDEAIAISATKNMVLYARVSERPSVRNGSLGEQRQSLLKATAQMQRDGWRRKAIIECQEHGKLSCDRQHLLRALEVAKKYKAILVAVERTRLIKPEHYDRRKPHKDEPTGEEWARFFELADGVLVATVMDPKMTYEELQSLRTTRSGNCGRPSTIDRSLIVKVLSLCEAYEWCVNIVHEDAPISLGKIAAKLGIPKVKVQRIVNQQIPHPRYTGQSWKHLKNPYTVFRKLEKDREEMEAEFEKGHE